MVMHARKTQRMSDGYFEKHQAHPYQNSKYGSSKNYGSSSDRYEKSFRDSPNGNYRSDSPDSQSPRDRDRSYGSKNSYLQKMHNKERENRDYKVSRDKYLDCNRSPKDKRNREDHRINNDRNDDKGILHPSKRDDRDRLTKVGDWSEHVSSSGKKYYYNCKTEVSQWEKPREWLDRERERDRFRRDRERDDRGYGGSSRSSMRHDKHSSSRGPISSGNSSKDNGNRHWSSSGRDSVGENSLKDARSTSSRRHSNPDNSVQSTATQDMDISPGDSTPTSEVSYTTSSSQPTPLVVEQPVSGPVLLANALPRLTSHPTSSAMLSQASPSLVTTKVATPTLSTSPPQQVVPPVALHASNAPGPPNQHGILGNTGTPLNRLLSSDDPKKVEALSVDINNHSEVVGDGPPTPTHSEIPECPTKVLVPTGSPPAGSLPSLQGVASSLQALRPQGPTITPSLANHYRDDLVNHVRGWPADILEKQAQKLAEEAHIMGSIQCSKVSADLKSARSIVRLTEIQATLQEQRLENLCYSRSIMELKWLRFCLINHVKNPSVFYLCEDVDFIKKNQERVDRILFLRQQIKELEELKSQNSFMSDDC